MHEEMVPVCARMVQPLFPRAWDLATSIRAENDIAKFWDLFEQLIPPLSSELWEELRRRERMFAHVALSQGLEEEVRRGARELLDKLAALREQDDWSAYVQSYLDGVRAILGALIKLEIAP